MKPTLRDAIGEKTGQTMARSKITPPRKGSKNGKMRSSPEARKLIKAYIKHYGCERKAAERLHMTHGQLNGIKTGRLKDTEAMKIALKRADSRARRAWAMVDKEDTRHMIDDKETLKATRRVLKQALYMVDVLIDGEA